MYLCCPHLPKRERKKERKNKKVRQKGRDRQTHQERDREREGENRRARDRGREGKPGMGSKEAMVSGGEVCGGGRGEEWGVYTR